MHPPIRTPLTLLPPLQHLPPHTLLNLQNLDPNRPTRTLHIRLSLALVRLMPPPRTQITSWTRTQRTQQILLCEEGEKAVFGGWTRFHEVAALGVEAGDLEDVEHVVDVEFGEAVGQDGAREVGVAVEVVGGVCEHCVYYVLSVHHIDVM